MSYENHENRGPIAVASAFVNGHEDPESLRKLLIFTRDASTAPIADAYFVAHRNDPKLLEMLVVIALEGEDAGDAPWAAANQIADFPPNMLLVHKGSLERLAREQRAYLHVPARKALAKIAAADVER